MSGLTQWAAQYWLGIAFAGISAACATLFTQYKALRAGLRALLRDRIIQSYNYRMEQGYCPIYALETIMDMHHQYKRLKGNHGVDELIAKLKQLPTQPPRGTAK